jgi:hypothetical protein
LRLTVAAAARSGSMHVGTMLPMKKSERRQH